jgi:6,7-dimethyl-8-ribityllumazine synthase
MSNAESLDVSDYAFAILVSDFHSEITSRLLEGAQRALNEGKALDVDVFHVPGAFELPLAGKLLAETDDYDAIVCLGCVIRGETSHYEIICNEAARGILQASLMTGVPMSFGVLTTESAAQAEARAGSGNDNKGWEAARTAMQMAVFVGSLPDTNVSDQMIIVDDALPFDDEDEEEDL